MKLRYAVVIEKAPNNYGAYAPDVLGCIATAKTRDETVELMREALELHIELTLEDGDALPQPRMSIRDAIADHISALDEEFPPEFEDYEETETSFIMLEVEVKTAQAVAEAEPAAHVKTTGIHHQFQHPHKPGTLTISGHPEDDFMKGAYSRMLKQAGLK